MGSFRDSENYRLSKDFPALIEFPLQRDSDPTPFYNCFAFVAGDTDRPWNPTPIPLRGCHWPVKVADCDENTIWPVLYAYNHIGYELCENGDLEDGVEKIAIYICDETEEPMHVAAQNANGTWRSKIGSDIDVIHTLASLASHPVHGRSIYGTPKYFMMRKRNS